MEKAFISQASLQPVPLCWGAGFPRWDKQQADQGRRKAAVVQAEAAVHIGHRGNQQEMGQSKDNA